MLYACTDHFNRQFVILQAIYRHHVAMINSAIRGDLERGHVSMPVAESTMQLMAMVRKMC